MKPMLASAIEDIAQLNFPVMASPKFDGVRCLIINGTAMSRSLKPIPNEYIQMLFGRKAFHGLDGELIVGDPTSPDAYRTTTSGVMSEDGEPSVTFHVFDDFNCKGPFQERLASVEDRLDVGPKKLPWTVVRHQSIYSVKDLNAYEDKMLERGYEGVMLRDPQGPYKEGRATEKEAWLLKLKRFRDSEAVIVDYHELMINKNEAKRNALGHSERSSHKANLAPAETLGSLTVRDLNTDVTFDIGSGFTVELRDQLWKDDHLIGKVIKYKYQPVGVKDKPRFPVFLGFRDARDR